MKSFNQLLILSILSLLLFNCSDSEDEVEKKVLHTYTIDDSSFKVSIILSDLEGNILDFQNVPESGQVELSGPSHIKRFTITKIDYTQESFAKITVYHDIASSAWNDPGSLRENEGTPVKVTVDEGITGRLIITGFTEDDYTSELDQEIIYSSEENKLSVVWNQENEPPKFAIYTDLTDGMELNMVPEDFSEMTYHTLESIPENGKLYWQRAKTSATARKEYNVLGFSVLPIETGFYYPAGSFDYWITGFRFHESNTKEYYYSDYYGELPTKIEKMDIGEFSLNKETMSYEAFSSNPDVDIVRSRFANGVAQLVTYEKNGSELFLNKIIEKIEEEMEALDAGNLIWQSTYLYEIDGIDFDQFISDPLIGYTSTENVKSWKYYSVNKN